MTAFDVAIGTIFNDPNIQESATATPAAGGPAFTVKCSIKRPDRVDGGFNGHAFAAPAVVAEVPKAEWAAPVKGDAFSCADGNFTVDYVGVDLGGLVWRLDLKKAA
jgi:hypothetical protein